MSVNKLLPDDYRRYVELFHRCTYKETFNGFLQQIQEMPSALSDMKEAEKAALSLLERVEGLITAKRFGKKLRLTDIRSFLLFYLLPAIGQSERGSDAFIQAILSCWNKKYPADKLVYMSYQEICSGFRNTYMGFEIGGKNDR